MRLAMLASAMVLFVVQMGVSQTVPVAQIDKSKVKQTVQVSGTVESFRASRSEKAPNSFKLKDQSGSIRVAIWPDVFNAIPAKDAVKDGANVTVKAEVAEFRGAIELHVNQASDVQVAGASSAAGAAVTSQTAPAATSATSDVWGKAPAAGTKSGGSGGVEPISSLTRERSGQEVTIVGKVSSARAPSSETAPYIFKIADSTGSVDVVFWKDTAEKLSDAQKVNVGDQVWVHGKLGEHRGNLQIRVEDPKGIQSPKSDPKLFESGNKAGETSATQSRADIKEMPLSQIGQANVRQLVKIKGKVTAMEPIRAGRQLKVRDASGEATVLLWDTAEGLNPELHKLQVGDNLAVDGVIADSNGKRVLEVGNVQTAPGSAR